MPGVNGLGGLGWWAAGGRPCRSAERVVISHGLGPRSRADTGSSAVSIPAQPPCKLRNANCKDPRNPVVMARRKNRKAAGGTYVAGRGLAGNINR